jgi:hypothetical protein
MPVQPFEVQWYLSAPAAGAGYTTAGTPGNSLGNYMSTSQLNQSTPLDNLFLDISGPENTAGQVAYQCVFLMNNTTSGLLMYQIYVSFPSVYWTNNGAGLAIGLDPTGITSYNSASQQAVLINNPNQAPAGVNTWYTGPHTSFTQGCPSGSLFPQQVVPLWIRQTAVNSPELTPQTAGLTATYQTDS